MYFKRQFKVALPLYKDLNGDFKCTKAFVMVTSVVSVAGFRSIQKSANGHRMVSLFNVCGELI